MHAQVQKALCIVGARCVQPCTTKNIRARNLEHTNSITWASAANLVCRPNFKQELWLF